MKVLSIYHFGQSYITCSTHIHLPQANHGCIKPFIKSVISIKSILYTHGLYRCQRIISFDIFSTKDIVYFLRLSTKISQTNSKNKNCVCCWIPCLYRYHYFCKVARHSCPPLTRRICPKILLYTGTESCPSNRYNVPHSCMDCLNNHWHLKR